MRFCRLKLSLRQDEVSITGKYLMFSSKSESASDVLEISLGQALLLLIDKYHTNKLLLERLSKIYLLGITQDDLAELRDLLQDSILAKYKISYTNSTIDNDPTRRYFETHLAFHSLTTTITELKETDLSVLDDALCDMLRNSSSYRHFESVKDLLAGNDDTHEYSDLIKKLKLRTYFQDQPQENIKKMMLLASSACLSVFITNQMDGYGHAFPIGIYNDSDSLYANHKRGRQEKKDQKQVRSQNLGLMKSTMFVPQDDLAFTDKVSTGIRVADKFRFIPAAEWPEINFASFMHPFSASISGTLLCQLKVFSYLACYNQLPFNSYIKLKSFFKCCTSLLLYHSGGHSFNEFLAPLRLYEVQQFFKTIPNFEELNFYNLFYKDNKKAFSSALKETREYNKLYLKKIALNRAIRSVDYTVFKAFSFYNRQVHAHAADFHKMLEQTKTLSLPKAPAQRPGFFINTTDLTPQVLELVEIITDEKKYLVGYQPYEEQIVTSHLIGKGRPLAKKIMQQLLMLTGEVINCSDNYGMTLLHHLIWNDRPDLANLVIRSPKFTKINYKFCIPSGTNSIYASALDLSIGLWGQKKTRVEINFIEALLQYGALPPKPGQKFLDTDLFYFLFPLIVINDSQAKKTRRKKKAVDADKPRSTKEIIDLLCLLESYDFELKAMADEFRARSIDIVKNKAFQKQFQLNNQQVGMVLDRFMNKLNHAVSKHKKGERLIKFNSANLDNGESCLDLPFDPIDRAACIVM